MWKILVFVLLFSYLVLFLLLRSVLLPLKAVLMNLLSVAAAYGVLVAVFQYGWLDGLLGFESLGYINTMTPPFLLAIVFGLSMDYEVFLLSRIRERYDATGDTRTAVAQGLRAQRGDDLERGADHGRRVRGLRRHRRAVDQGDRPRPVGGDRARRDAGPADPGAGHDGDHGPLELVAAEAARRACCRTPTSRAAAAERGAGPGVSCARHGAPCRTGSGARPRCCAWPARTRSRSPPACAAGDDRVAARARPQARDAARACARTRGGAAR